MIYPSRIKHSAEKARRGASCKFTLLKKYQKPTKFATLSNKKNEHLVKQENIITQT